jgi:hypothetical protein
MDVVVDDRARTTVGGFGRRHRHVPTRTIGALFSVLVFLATQVSMLFRSGGGLGNFRSYAAVDQLANYAMVVNGARGDAASVEPFTKTGTMVDPHLYFNTVGRVAHLLGVSPVLAYNVAGIGLQILLVIGLSIGFVLITRQWWTAYLGALPLLIGTLSSVYSGGWYTLLQSHALLWGAFGDMFAINSQSAALVLGGLFLTMLVIVAMRRFDDRASLLLGVGVGAGVGLLANVDTYGFFAALFFVAFGLSVYAMAVEHRWWPPTLTALALIVVFADGDHIASSFGRVFVFLLALVPAVPGVLLAVARWRWRVVLPIAALVVGAAPQLVTYALALHDRDPFLTFRTASNPGLGVSALSGFVCATPLLVPLLMILFAGVHQRRPLWIAYPVGCALAWFLLATNDVWGANQEPYQLWIDGFTLTALTIIPIAVDVARSYWPRRAGHPTPPPRAARAVVATLLVASVVLVVISADDWLQFYRSQEGQFLSFDTPEEQAWSAVSTHVSGHDLVAIDTCIDPNMFKAVTGAAVDFYNPGLAWPARKVQIDRANATISSATVTPDDLRSAGIGWLVTDDACRDQWPRRLARLIVPVARHRYGVPAKDVIELWKFRTQTSRTPLS